MLKMGAVFSSLKRSAAFSIRAASFSLIKLASVRTPAPPGLDRLASTS